MQQYLQLYGLHQSEHRPKVSTIRMNTSVSQLMISYGKVLFSSVIKLKQTILSSHHEKV